MRTYKAGTDISKCIKIGGGACDICTDNLGKLRRALQEGTEPDPFWLNIVESGIYRPTWYNYKDEKVCAGCNRMMLYLHRSSKCLKCAKRLK